jgi:hypothetical protein
MRTRVALVCLVLGLAGVAEANAAALSGVPDPVQVCDGTGLAQMTIAWNAADSNPTQVEIHVGSATGQLFAAGLAVGSAVTGKWVSNGTIFFLVGGADKKVLAQYTARLTTSGCPAPPEPRGFWRRLFGK